MTCKSEAHRAQLADARRKAQSAVGVVPPYVEDREAEGIGSVALRVMIEIALHQRNLDDRRAMLGVLRDDGWISAQDCARLGGEAEAA